LYRTGPLFAAAVLALALASCGGGEGNAGTEAAKEPPVRMIEVSGSEPKKNDKSAAAKSAATSGCRQRLGEFVGRMNDLRHALLAGLSYAEYVVRVRAIRDAYEAVPVEHLGVSCLRGPAANAEEAFNEYLRAANAWGECAGTEGCAASEIEGKLQRRWRTASKSLDAAQRG
jgi:hypothetical protein